jgi:hypothetical protein
MGASRIRGVVQLGMDCNVAIGIMVLSTPCCGRLGHIHFSVVLDISHRVTLQEENLELDSTPKPDKDEEQVV